MKTKEIVKELIEDGIDYLDYGMDLRLTLAILRDGITIDENLWDQVVSTLTAHK